MTFESKSIPTGKLKIEISNITVTTVDEHHLSFLILRMTVTLNSNKYEGPA